jgi:hypothetical protein
VEESESKATLCKLLMRLLWRNLKVKQLSLEVLPREMFYSHIPPQNLIRSLHRVVLLSDFLHNNLIRSLHRVVLLSDSSTITSLEVYIELFYFQIPPQ